MINNLLEWIKIGLSGFILSLVMWISTKRYYKKQIAEQIYIGPVLNDIYKPLIEEYKRVHYGIINDANSVLDVRLITNIIRSNSILLNTMPKKIKSRIELIERLCLSNADLNKFESKSNRILDELNNLNKDLAKFYKEFVYE